MVSRYLLETGTDRFLMEDGAGVLVMEQPLCYSAVVLAETSLISYWRLGEPTGTVAADAKGTNTGTYTNTPTLGVAGALSGDNNTSVTFVPASLHYVSVPDAAAFSLTATNQLSIEAWANPIVNAGLEIVSKAAAAAFEWSLRRNSNQFQGIIWDSGGVTRASVFSDPITPATGWYHVVVTIDNVAPRLVIYVNGVAYGSTGTFTGTSTDGTAPLNIGRRGDAVNYFDGSIDEVAIYNAVLTPTQVATHYAARSVSCPPVPRISPYPQLLPQ